jgi:hypothetical protein
MTAARERWEGGYSVEKLAEFEAVVLAFAGRRSGGWLRAPCRRCEDTGGKPDRKASLAYNSATGGYCCNRCGMKGALPRDWREKLELVEAEELRSPVRSNDHLSHLVPVEPCWGYRAIYDEPGSSAAVFDAARRYVEGRGVLPAVARTMGVGSAASGPLAGRAVVPLPDYDRPGGPWHGWFARDFSGRAYAPHRYAKGMSRAGYLFNAPALLVEAEEPCLVVEGCFDCAPVWPDAVAVLGKPIESQLAVLRAARRPVCVCLDGDAWTEGLALSWTLQHLGVRAGNVRLPPKTDPDEVDPVWLREEARRACRLT